MEETIVIDDKEEVENVDNENSEKTKEGDEFEMFFDEEKEEKEKKPEDLKEEKNIDNDLIDIFGEISDDEEEEVVEDYQHSKFSKPSGEIIKLKLPDSIKVKPSPFESENDNNVEKNPTIRFRYMLEETNDGEDYKKDENGDFMTESNCKVVKFSDGSYRMYIGKESFDILNTNLTSRNQNSHVFVSDVEEKSFIDSGKIKESWKIKSKFGKIKSGYGFGESFRRRTKLTDVKLDKEHFYDTKPRKLSLDKEVKALKETQRRKMRKERELSKEFLEDGDGVSIKQIKKDSRRRRKKKKRKKRKRIKRKRVKKDNDEYEDDGFIEDDEDDEDEDDNLDDELEEDEFDDEDDDEEEDINEVRKNITGKKRKRRRRGKGKGKGKDSGSSDEEFLKKELILYDDESGSDSDETYRPFSPKKKRRKTN